MRKRGSSTETIHIKKHGSFSLVAKGDHHCGTEPILQAEFTFSVIAEATSTDDSRGFLFDQLRIPAYFDKMKSTTLSCEKLCRRSARALVRMILAENPKLKIKKVELSLGPSASAWMTYTCRGSSLALLCECAHRANQRKAA